MGIFETEKVQKKKKKEAGKEGKVANKDCYEK